MFGRAKVVLARLVVPTIELLDVHDEVCRLCLPHLQPGPLSNAVPGQWTAHVTLARRLVPAQLGRALRIAGKPPEIVGSVAGLRRWDGNVQARVPDHLTSAAKSVDQGRSLRVFPDGFRLLVIARWLA